jgi:hypothetical protein
MKATKRTPAPAAPLPATAPSKSAPPKSAPVKAPTITGTTETAYTRTAKDTAAVTTFIDCARQYDKQTHGFAVACARMMAEDLHNREGIENFGVWCSIEFGRHGIGLEGRNAYRLAQVGKLLAEFNNAPALLALPSRALTGLVQNRERLETQGLDLAEVAETLPTFMKEQKIGNALDAVTALATFGVEGDQRSPELRRADERATRRASLVEQIANFIKSEAELDKIRADAWKAYQSRGLKRSGATRDE